MNFDHRQGSDSPELNLIPLIDVLLVILIFLAATTSFTRQRQLEITLPQAQANQLEQDAVVQLSVNRDGLFALDGQLIDANDDTELASQLRVASARHKAAALRIDADARATHAAVVRALEAARLAGIEQIQFLTQSPP